MVVYDIKQVEEMFRIVEEVKNNLEVIYQVHCGDPRFDCKEEEKRLKKLIPEYRRKVPVAVQKVLKITPNDLERLLR